MLKFFYTGNEYSRAGAHKLPRHFKPKRLMRRSERLIYPIRPRRVFVDGRLSQMVTEILEESNLVDAVFEGELTEAAELDMHRYDVAIVSNQYSAIGNVTDDEDTRNDTMYDDFITYYARFLQQGGKLITHEGLWSSQTRVIRAEGDGTVSGVEQVRYNLRNTVSSLGGGVLEYVRVDANRYWIDETDGSSGDVGFDAYFGAWCVVDPADLIDLDLPVGTWSGRFYLVDGSLSESAHMSCFSEYGNAEPIIPVNRTVHSAASNVPGSWINFEAGGHLGLWFKPGTMSIVPKGSWLLFSAPFLFENTLNVGDALEPEIPNNEINKAYFKSVLEDFLG